MDVSRWLDMAIGACVGLFVGAFVMGASIFTAIKLNSSAISKKPGMTHEYEHSTVFSAKRKEDRLFKINGNVVDEDGNPIAKIERLREDNRLEELEAAICDLGSLIKRHEQEFKAIDDGRNFELFVGRDLAEALEKKIVREAYKSGDDYDNFVKEVIDLMLESYKADYSNMFVLNPETSDKIARQKEILDKAKSLFEGAKEKYKEEREKMKENQVSGEIQNLSESITKLAGISERLRDVSLPEELKQQLRDMTDNPSILEECDELKGNPEMSTRVNEFMEHIVKAFSILEELQAKPDDSDEVKN